MAFLVKRGQTTTEYLFLAVGVIIFIVLIYTLLQGNLVNPSKQKVAGNIGDFLKYGEYSLFFDNFDSGSANQWTSVNGNWQVLNNEYVQADTSNIEKTAYAGSSGWVNYYAETKIQFTSLPSSALPALLGGIGGRVNKNNGNRYACMVALYTNGGGIIEGKISLYKFFGWQTLPVLLNSSATLLLDTGAHTLAIQFVGNSVACYYDNEQKVSYDDSTPFRFGAISLEQKSAEAHFDSVRVKSQAGPNPSGLNPTNPPDAIPLNVSPSPSTSPSPSSSPIPLSCSDGTFKGVCSTATPGYYCDSVLNLVANCTGCGCAGGYSCNATSQLCYNPAAGQAPVISNVTCSNATYYSLTVTWTTDILSDSAVISTTNYTKNESVLSHSIWMNNLPSSTYVWLFAKSCSSGNCTISGQLDCSTSAAPQSASVSIQSLVVWGITDVNASISWQTNINANASAVISNYQSGLDDLSYVTVFSKYAPIAFSDYTGRISFGAAPSSTPTPTPSVTPTPTPVPTITIRVNNSNLGVYHSFNIGGLTPNTTFYYQVTSCANATNCVNSSINTFGTEYCNDTDNGIFPNTTGVLTNNAGSFSDVCTDNVTLMERYCSGYPTKYIATNLNVNCLSCSNGACSGVYCYASGNSIYTQDSVYTDVCIDNVQYNYYCHGAYPAYTTRTPCSQIG